MNRTILKMLPISVAAGTLALASVAFAGPGEPIFFAPHMGQPIPASQLPKVSDAARAAAPKAVIKAAPTFNVTYLDGAGVGFNDPTHGTNRKAVMTAVLTYIASQLDETGGICDVEVTASEFGADGFLAAAGPFYSTVNGFFPGSAFTHITTGVDPFPGATPDIQVTVDFGYTWNNDTGPVAPGEYDLYSVLLHEITHGLGILSLTKSNGASQFTDFSPPNNTNTFTTYDALLYGISGGTKVWNAGSQAFQLANLTGGDGYIEFRGTNAQSSYPTSVFPRVYTPVSFVSGSSVSHWQFNSPTPSAAVMRHAISANTMNRTYQTFELKALQDLGYTLAVSGTKDWHLY